MEKKKLESFTANEFSALEMAEIKGGREITPEDETIQNQCQTYCGGSHCGPWCVLEQES